MKLSPSVFMLLLCCSKTLQCKGKSALTNNSADNDNSAKESLESHKVNNSLDNEKDLENIKVEKFDMNGTLPPWTRPGVVRIVLISDTHNKHRQLNMPPGDILIHSGDFTNRGSLKEIQEFDTWLGDLPYQHKVVVPGNHDTAMDPAMWDTNPHIHDIEDPTGVNKTHLIKNAKVLINETVAMKGLTIFGFPYTVDPFGLSWWAFKAHTETELDAELSILAHATDIVVTHTPPYGIGDLTWDGTPVGSKAVLNTVVANNPALHVFGHIHEAAGAYVYAKGRSKKGKTTFINASLVTWSLKPLGPVVVDISEETKTVLNVIRYLEK